MESQARENLAVAESISGLHEDMKSSFSSILSPNWSVQALDYSFAHPIFRNSDFTNKSGIPAATAARLTRVLLDQGLLQTIRAASGRRPATYRFEPLMARVRV